MEKKLLAAVIAVAIALTGVFSGIKWLTVAALLLWVIAMIYFGFGNRTLDRDRPSSD